ncbi:DUF6340 family protein [Maribellus sp. YY47]|uniref:DUF6340 family protein n=1 Tax=Maribellus sp. YY47 TaxID=2929486 RepID=UPI0020017D6F|nr:DUF6340 family protein [Maribellus sp. YY47]MCK3685015.1 tetratricopeptide repeat protein [Maribellus sp. YY47]
MKRLPLTLITVFFIAAFLQGCARFLQTSSIKIEVLQPAEITLPKVYRKLAVRYNNTNVAYNPELIHYKVLGQEMSDTSNMDSVASKIYYDYFLAGILEQDFFDRIIELEPCDYSSILVKDTLNFHQLAKIDSTANPDSYIGYVNSFAIASYLKELPASTENKADDKMLDPEFGLYTSNELKAISDSTGADFLLSLDHFFTRNEIDTNETFAEGYYNVTELAEVNALWSIYDLNKNMFLYHYLHKNPITWEGECIFLQNALKVVPPRRDAVLNSADMNGTQFAQMIIPHWMEVERMYYKSGHPDLKQSEDFLKKGNWLEAANYWKKNIDNPNKRIAAKCMYNLGLACEMEGDIDAAIDWVVRSYHIFGEKDEIHSYNCKSYLNILGVRKLDFRILDKQMSFTGDQQH